MKKQFILSFFLVGIICSKLVAQNTWTQKTYFDSIGRSGAVGFSINGKGYIGTGANSNGGSRKDLWEFDPITNVWAQKADLGGEARHFATGFSIDSYGYIGTGDGVDPLNDFWQYNPVSNSWTKKANFPGGKRMWAMGFSIGDKGYIGGGTPDNQFKKDWWEYDPATNTWTQKADIANAGRAKCAAFSIGAKGYLCTGEGYSAGSLSELREYDLLTDQWTLRQDFPGGTRVYAVAFVVDGKGYVGTGSSDADTVFRDFWSYDPLTDSWSEAPDLPGLPRYRAVAFAVNEKGYVGTGQQNLDDYLDDFWQYAPECEAPTGLATTNIKSASAKVNWTIEPTAQTYSVRYRKTGSIPWTKTSAQLNYKKLTGLLPDTQYDWAVKSVCDPVNSISSDWSAIQNFTTKPLRLENESEEATPAEVYPNPATESAIISFSLRESSHSTIELFDLAGRRMDRLLDQYMEAGDHELLLHLGQLSGGTYFLKMKINDEISIIKVIAE